MNTELLNALKDRVHKTAMEHGFHEDEKSDAYWLGLVMSEMGEVINADMKEFYADTRGFVDYMNATKFYFCKAFESYIKYSVEDKIAGIVIRLLDFAGLKGYELCVEVRPFSDCERAEWRFDEGGLSAMLFYLMDILTDCFDYGELRLCISNLIYILSNLFEKMTDSSKDFWWFVEKRMEYNEQQPKLNGKKY